MPFVAYFLLGLVAGTIYFSWVRRAQGSVRVAGAPADRRGVLSMLARLALFAGLLALVLRASGPTAGFALVLGLLATRTLMAHRERRASSSERP